jgi:hypothetical protein
MLVKLWESVAMTHNRREKNPHDRESFGNGRSLEKYDEELGKNEQSCHET